MHFPRASQNWLYGGAKIAAARVFLNRVRRFDSCRGHRVMSRDIVPTCVGTSFHVLGSSVRLVVAAGIEGELADELAILGDHPDPQVLDERDHPSPDELAPKTDVVQP